MRDSVSGCNKKWGFNSKSREFLLEKQEELQSQKKSYEFMVIGITVVGLIITFFGVSFESIMVPFILIVGLYFVMDSTIKKRLNCIGRLLSEKEK